MLVRGWPPRIYTRFGARRIAFLQHRGISINDQLKSKCQPVGYHLEPRGRFVHLYHTFSRSPPSCAGRTTNEGSGLRTLFYIHTTGLACVVAVIVQKCRCRRDSRLGNRLPRNTSGRLNTSRAVLMRRGCRNTRPGILTIWKSSKTRFSRAAHHTCWLT
jgi:hypothetical protein